MTCRFGLGQADQADHSPSTMDNPHDANHLDRPEPEPLRALAGLTPCQSALLEGRWITTVDALVAAACTKEGRRGLCELLGVEEPALEDLLDGARQLLGEARYRELAPPRAGGLLGALYEQQDLPGGNETDSKPEDSRT